MIKLRRYRSWLFSFLICLGLGLSQSAFSMTEEEREAKLAELKTTIAELKQELDKIKGDRSALLEDLEVSETKIGELSQKVKELQMQLDDKQANLLQLRSEKEALARVKKLQQGSVKQHINAAYRLGQQSSVKLLLNQGDPSKLSRNLKYFDFFIRARAEKIKQYVATITRINEVEPAIESTIATIAQQKSALANKRKSLVAEFATRQETLKKLQKAISSKGAELTNLETNRKRLEDLFQKVVQVVGNFTLPVKEQPFNSLKGKMPWPTKGQVLERYGSYRVANKVKWQGMLIQAAQGNPVNAIHHGRVVFSDYLRGHGLLIIVDHGGGYMSLYAHNQALYKELGDWVSAHEQIASVGQSGGQNKSGLYFELRYQGAPTDPTKWLTKA